VVEKGRANERFGRSVDGDDVPKFEGASGLSLRFVAMTISRWKRLIVYNRRLVRPDTTQDVFDGSLGKGRAEIFRHPPLWQTTPRLPGGIRYREQGEGPRSN
jgi:hypothetical protein